MGFVNNTSMLMIVKDIENDERLLLHTTSNVAKLYFNNLEILLTKPIRVLLVVL